MDQQELKRYAELLVTGVNVQPGQNLLVRGEPVHWPLIAAIGEAAYARGAKYVHPDSDHPALYRARIEHSRREFLDYVPRTVHAFNEILIEEKWALISIKNPEDPDYLADLDQERNAVAHQARARAAHPLRRALQADKFQWLVCASPTTPWARKVLGSSADADTLWRVMYPIARLDHDDPASQWYEHGAELTHRAEALQGMAIDSLRFRGPGTDLSVGLPENVRWLGGGAETPDGVRFLPNLPTEEVFTTPDFRRTSGEARVTRPVQVLGREVEGAWFRFEEGKVVDFRAEHGEETLARYLEIDEGAPYLGEVALVDTGSPIFQSGTVFYNILFDENAASHIALGSAYPGGIQGGDELSEEKLKRAGVNVATVHTDFMIGSEEVSVTARTTDGQERPIITEGRFVI